MNDKLPQSQPPPTQNVGTSHWPQQWPNIQNPFVQQRPYAYWPHWGHYSMNMTPPNNMMPHPPIPFQSMNVPNFGFQSQMNFNNNPSTVTDNCNGKVNTNKINSPTSEMSMSVDNPPLPDINADKKSVSNDDSLKSLENPDKIPLPDGPPPSNKAFPPLPTTNNSNLNPPFFNSNSQPIKFNLNQSNKTFTPFNLTNKKKRNKNKNQTANPFGNIYNQQNMPLNYNKLYNIGNNAQNSLAPPLPPNKPKNVAIDTAMEQDNVDKLNTTVEKEIKSPSQIMQNQQSSHDDWPPSLL